MTLGIEILKAIDYTIQMRPEAFNPTILTKHIFQKICRKILPVIESQKKIGNLTNFKNKILDGSSKKPERGEILSAATLMYKILRGP